MQGLKYRYWDSICSEVDPSTPEGAMRWDDHQQAYDEPRQALEDEIDEFNANCEGDLPVDAKQLANTKYPDKSEWRGNTPECERYRREREQRYAGD